ncbi:hypothetical protein J2751_002800 [Halorubrum alkaliphilum]|uniref:Uncharacterized protein n=1 Tax=Halorubrum alkaliphilum TaxID=261290 RepID=A0A8T4GLA4_9EURY|nr:hypothetical protein [Halorubrum alkaliphilum]
MGDERLYRVTPALEPAGLPITRSTQGLPITRSTRGLPIARATRRQPIDVEGLHPIEGLIIV